MLCDLLVLLFIAAVAVKIQKDREEAITRRIRPKPSQPVQAATWTYKDRHGKVHTEICT
jgi:hypothetical protein